MRSCFIAQQSSRDIMGERLGLCDTKLTSPEVARRRKPRDSLSSSLALSLKPEQQPTDVWNHEGVLSSHNQLPLKFLSDSAESYLAATVYLLQH